MNYLRSLIVAIVLGLSLPMMSQGQFSRISTEGIQQARECYALEAQRAPYMRAGIGVGLAAIVGALTYKYLWMAPVVVAPEFVDLARNVSDLSHDMRLVKAGKKLELTPETWGEWGKRNACSIGSSLAFNGTLSLASALVITPVLEGVITAKSMLPSSGDLSWYLKNRTSFSQNLADMKRYLMHQVRRTTFSSIIPLFVADVEKIIGYIQHTGTNLGYEPVVIRFTTICENLELWTNELVSIIEEKSDLALIQEQLFKIEAEVHSAMRLVKIYT